MSPDYLKALLGKATPGPWQVEHINFRSFGVTSPDCDLFDGVSRQDAAAICALRNAGEALVSLWQIAEQIDVVMDTAAVSGVRDILAPAYAEGWSTAHVELRKALKALAELKETT